jgi:tetratricopeptide (TPR) repeat protein
LEGKWQEGAASFETHLKEFPQSTNRISVLRHIVNCRLEDVKRASLETETIKKESLLSALNAALGESKHFSPQEKQKMRYLLGKTEFELARYDEAIGNLSEYVRDFQKDPTCSDAYLLLAYSYQKGSRDEIHFALNAEKALNSKPRLQGAVDLHLTLFNTYLGLAGKVSQDEKAEMIAKAANHLFLALDKPVSKENQRWLAGYYFQQHQNGEKGAVERVAIVLEKLLDVKENSFALQLTAQSLDMEGEAIKLADIYGKSGRLSDRAKLLESLMKEQSEHTDWHWKYQRMAHFELGKTYLSLGEREKALATFEALISSSSHTSSYFAIAAQIEMAKLDFSMLKAEDRCEDSLSAVNICNTLKEIQIQRKLHSEPLHLEAALCYVDLKAELAPIDVRKNRARFLLEQMKENFSAPEDPIVKQYLLAASQFPEKERLFHQYLAFVDLDIKRLGAEEERNVLLLRETQGLMSKLHSESLDENLTKRIAKSIEALEKVL